MQNNVFSRRLRVHGRMSEVASELTSLRNEFKIGSEEMNECWVRESVVVESLAVGVPVVAAPVQPIPDILAGAGTSALVRREVAPVVDECLRLLRAPRDLEAIRRYALAYSWDGPVQLLAQVYREAAVSAS